MKSQRQAKIIEIISTRNVETQEQLLAALQQEGFRGTQATISRDIKELQLIKVLSASGKYKYAVSTHQDTPISDRFINIFRETITSFASAETAAAITFLSGKFGFLTYFIFIFPLFYEWRKMLLLYWKHR